MITLAGPSSSAMPISPSSKRTSRRVRRRVNRAIGGTPIARSPWVIGALPFIGYLPANCENACFLILQPGADRCQDGIHGLSPDHERTAIPWRRGGRPLGNPPVQVAGGWPRSAGRRSPERRGADCSRYLPAGRPGRSLLLRKLRR